MLSRVRPILAWRRAFLLVALAAAPASATAASEYLARPFAMLGLDGGAKAFQLTPEGWIRTRDATLSVTANEVPLSGWAWVDGEPGVARATAAGAVLRLEAEVAAIALPGLEVDAVFSPSVARPESIRARMANPVALLRLRFDPPSAGAGGGPVRIVLRLASDAGQAQALALRDGIVSRRFTPPRAAAFEAGAGGAGGAVVVADSLVLVASARPDSVAAGIGLDGNPAPDLLELVYRPRAVWELEVRAPALPVPRATAAALVAGDGEQLLADTRSYWRERLAGGARLSLPEPEVAAAARASLYHILAGSLVGAGDRLLVLGSPFLYRQFYMRDAAYVVAALDRFGFHADARGALEYMLAYQTPAGELVSHRDQHDGNGQALWALGEHLALTRDREFAAACMERVGKAVAWYRKALTPAVRAEWDRDFPGLLPAATVEDAEQIVAGHIVGHNLWAHAGLAGAVEVARVAGAADSLRSWEKLLGRFHGVLERDLDDLLGRMGGILTPAFEGMEAQAGFAGAYGSRGGGNLEIVFPIGLWRGDDWRLRNNIDAWCAALKEGLFPYPLSHNEHLAHHYLATSLAHALLGSGTDADRERLFTIVYDGLLGHATGTMGGAQLVNIATRDVWPFENIPPHNTFSARYLLLIRDMLLAERGDTLVVGEGLSPAWLGPGARMELEGTATRFGWTSLGLEVASAGGGGAGGGAGLGASGGAGDSTLSLTVRLDLAAKPPARLGLAPRALPAPGHPLRADGPARPLGGLVFPAPLGYRITAVRDSTGARVGRVRAGGGQALVPPATRTFTVDLRGAADGRQSLAAARARLGLDRQ